MHKHTRNTPAYSHCQYDVNKKEIYNKTHDFLCLEPGQSSLDKIALDLSLIYVLIRSQKNEFTSLSLSLNRDTRFGFAYELIHKDSMKSKIQDVVFSIHSCTSQTEKWTGSLRWKEIQNINPSIFVTKERWKLQH